MPANLQMLQMLQMLQKAGAPPRLLESLKSPDSLKSLESTARSHVGPVTVAGTLVEKHPQTLFQTLFLRRGPLCVLPGFNQSKSCFTATSTTSVGLHNLCTLPHPSTHLFRLVSGPCLLPSLKVTFLSASLLAVKTDS
jgi:hypothetical protein